MACIQVEALPWLTSFAESIIIKASTKYKETWLAMYQNQTLMLWYVTGTHAEMKKNGNQNLNALWTVRYGFKTRKAHWKYLF